jgi:hypothetical protein
MIAYLYVAVVCVLLCSVGGSAWRLAAAVRLPRGLTTLVLVGLVAYLSVLIPGIMSHLAPWPIVACLVVCALFLLLLARLVRPVPLPSEQVDLPSDNVSAAASGAGWGQADYLLAAIGLLGCGPLLYEMGFSLAVTLLFPSEARLCIDVVSYHAPCMITFFQQGSFWDLRNSWQSYSYGYECIGNLLSIVFQRPWGLLLAHVYALGLMAAALVGLVRWVLWAWRPAPAVHRVPIILLTIGLWATAFFHAIRQVGKNDIFVAACVLAALVFLLQWATEIRHAHSARTRRVGLLLLTALAAGLALATKPTAAIYVIYFSGAIVLLRLTERGPTLGAKLYSAVVEGGLVGALASLIGGFFLVRNLIMIHALSAILNGFQEALVLHLAKSFIYRLRPLSLAIVFGVVLVALVAVVYRAYTRRGDGRSRVLALMAGFIVTATLVFIVNPNVILGNFYNVRFAMCMLAGVFVLGAMFARYVLSWFLQQRARLQWVLLALGGVLFVAAIAGHWQRHPAPGLAGWDKTYDEQPTDLYKWMNNQMATQCVLVASQVYPLGLYGRDWQNQVVTPPLGRFPEYSFTNVTQIAAAVVAYRPALVVASTDRLDAKMETVLARWMGAQTNLFETVYQDAAVTAFRVRPQAYTVLRTAP